MPLRRRAYRPLPSAARATRVDANCHPLVNGASIHVLNSLRSRHEVVTPGERQRRRGDVDLRLSHGTQDVPMPFAKFYPFPPSVKEIVAGPQNGYGAHLRPRAVGAGVPSGLDTQPNRVSRRSSLEACAAGGHIAGYPVLNGQRLPSANGPMPEPLPPRHGWSGSEKGTARADPERHCRRESRAHPRPRLSSQKSSHRRRDGER
ncbi:hypothetical protein DFH07DRAFT_445965 [Mycena maculata]|uniref:Uncharacterized protein n=1 Tax=Mycena maculata TaxID=230809 RepID=A0AAD7NG94_9AGAR|nr:hypothetical protein DFH07DRAFT_445965 [Mycena maculata]